MYKFYKKCSFIQLFSCNASYFLAKSSERLVVEVGNLSILGKLFFLSKNSNYIVHVYLFVEQIAKNKQTAWLLLFWKSVEI